ncbi:hypothetical protein P4O66_015614, partial [Electrophorus voltai]
EKGMTGKMDPSNGLNRPMDIVPNTEEKMKDRGQWSNKLEFVLSVAGEIIGLGNVWRFPYLCYKNGGGAFFIPYLIFLATCGIPVFFLETALGQYTSEGGVTCWRKISPLFEGIGYATQVIVALLNIYYIIVLAWGIFYLSFSFSWNLPWSSCNNTWNTGVLIYKRRVLRISSGIDDIGKLHWDMALCLLLAWIMCYFCIWKGVKSTGKVVYFTATFPYVMLLILLIRGITLPGASRGIQFYLYPDLGRLVDPQVWMDAGTQIFFSYAICLGCLTALGSYNKYNNNCYRVVELQDQGQFVCVESLVTAVVDMYPSVFRRKNRRELLILAVAIFSFLMGLIMLTEGGMYVFQLFDYYAASGMCLLFVAIFETICIAWIYGVDRFYDNIEDMIGYRPGPYIKYCWLFLTPATCFGTFAFSLIKYTPLKYNNEYVYPWWGYTLGWLLALSSMVCIPLWVIYKMGTAKGTLRERFYELATPSPDLPKTRREQEKLQVVFAADEDSPHQRGAPTKDGYFPVHEKESHC